MRKAPKGSPMHPIDAKINRIIAIVWAKVEHPFRVIKRQFGHVKTRYRGLAKNRAQLFTLFALGNLFLVRRKAYSMWTSLPSNRKTALAAGLKRRNPAEKLGGPPAIGIRPPSRHSRTR